MCLRPIHIEYVDFFGERQVRPVGCGKCFECLLQLQNMWKVRMIEESKCWKYCYFFTLTYSPENLPLNLVADYPDGREVVGELRGRAQSDLLLDSYEECLSTACKTDIQKWLKRFRTSYVRRKAKHLGLLVRDITSDKYLYDKFKPRFSYFITAEYAPDGEYVDRHGRLRPSTCRPHYHGMIFTDIPRRDMSLLFADWRIRFGFVKWSPVRPKNDSTNFASAPANYTAKYCAKGEFASRSRDVDDMVIEKPWRLISKGLGAAFVEKHKDYYVPPKIHMKYDEYVNIVLGRRYYSDGDFKYKLPRYYIERLYYDKKKFRSEVFHPKKKKMVVVDTYRYVATNMLSLALQAELQRRVLASNQQRFEVCQASHPDWTDVEVYSFLEHGESLSLESRRKVARDKLNRFYKDNERKNPGLMQ